MTTRPEAQTPQPAGQFGWCAWHQGSARGVRLIRIHEQGSGPGGGTYACQPCREKHHLTPLT